MGAVSVPNSENLKVFQIPSQGKKKKKSIVKGKYICLTHPRIFIPDNMRDT